MRKEPFMQKKPTGILTKWKVASLGLEMGFIIALPIAILGLIGKYLDERYQTHSIFRLIGLLLAIALSTVWLTRRFSEILKSMRSEEKEDKSNYINQ